jgi:hypothetical protein
LPIEAGYREESGLDYLATHLLVFVPLESKHQPDILVSQIKHRLKRQKVVNVVKDIINFLWSTSSPINLPKSISSFSFSDVLLFIVGMHEFLTLFCVEFFSPMLTSDFN